MDRERIYTLAAGTLNDHTIITALGEDLMDKDTHICWLLGG